MLKTEGVKGYKTFLKETIEDYGLDKNDLFELLSLCKNKDVARTLELIAKYEKA